MRGILIRLRGFLQKGGQGSQRPYTSAAEASPKVGPAAKLALGVGSAGTAWVLFSKEKYAEGTRRVGVASYYLTPILFIWKAHEVRVWARKMTPSEALHDASLAHTAIAKQMRDLALRLGGIYVKGGQHICAQPIVPKEYISVLSVLMDKAQRHPLADDALTFKEDLGCRFDEAFASFDPEPVASASIAQVYRASLADGRKVAVKIQQRPVARFLQAREERSRGPYVDLLTIEAYYDLLETLIKGLKLRWLADETRRHMTEELDFVAEAENARRARGLLQGEFPRGQLVIPEVVPALSSSRVLTMEWVDGVRVDDAAGVCALGASPKAVGALVQRVFASMIFRHGFVHCDPHPGNILVLPSGGIALLDHGVYRELSGALRRDYSGLWLAVLSGSKAAMQAACERLGVDPAMWRFVSLMLTLAPGKVDEEGHGQPGGAGFTDSERSHRSIADLSNEEKAEAMRKFASLGTFEQQMSLFEQWPADLLLVLKTNNLLRYVNDSLGGPVNRFRVIAEYAQKGAADAPGRRKGILWRLRVKLNTALMPMWVGLTDRAYRLSAFGSLMMGGGAIADGDRDR